MMGRRVRQLTHQFSCQCLCTVCLLGKDRSGLHMQVKLKHVETGAYLSSSPDKRYGRPISGQLEICGKSKAGKNELWIATEGVFFPEAAGL